MVEPRQAQNGQKETQVPKEKPRRSKVILRLTSIVAPIGVVTKTDNLPHIVFASCDAEIVAREEPESPNPIVQNSNEGFRFLSAPKPRRVLA